jgi:hypothetical protein
METGTGKTYVYLRTIFELSRRYGFQKFVIVVPGVAIREGVLKRRKRRAVRSNGCSRPTSPWDRSFSANGSSSASWESSRLS